LLIVNQNKDILNLFNEYFQSQGLKSILVDTGKKCLDEVRDRPQIFDVIILDTGLNDVRGLDVARKIVITTGYSDQALRREAESIGINYENVLLKPFKLSKLWSATMNN
jgi:DNA-binding response OmpR family regulator